MYLSFMQLFSSDYQLLILPLKKYNFYVVITECIALKQIMHIHNNWIVQLAVF